MLEQPVDNQSSPPQQTASPAAPVSPSSPTPSQDASSDIVAKNVQPKHTKPLFIGLVIVLILAALATGYYFTAYKNGGYKLTYGAYHFATMDTVTVLGDQAGHNASFIKPQEFFTPFAQSQYKQDAELYYYEVNNHHTQILGRVAFASSATPPRSDDFVKRYGINLMHPKEDLYEATIAPVKETIGTRMGADYTFKLGDVQEFRSPNISSRAWSVTFTANKVKNDAMVPEKMQGKLIFAMGKDAAYYLMMAAEPSTWRANQQTWQQMSDSLKIDQ